MTHDFEEAMSRHFESEGRGDAVGSESGSGDDTEAGSEARSRDDETNSSSEFDFDSGADRDSALESPPRKRTKRASRD